MGGIVIDKKNLEDIIEYFNSIEKYKKESVLLLLSSIRQSPVVVTEVYIPRQEATSHSFKLNNESNKETLDYLKKNRLFISAQIHTHPEEAFHSWVDDDMAIVTHKGAYSLVLPFFAKHITLQNFTKAVKVYCMSEEGRWDDEGSDSIIIEGIIIDHGTK